ncbi:MAG: YqaA family protein [bacterium]|nr:DedA family protein [bacterium]MDT8365686.1 YqaA family protein [bacterium]
MDFLTPEHGLVALFALSFLASTVLPLGSEWLLVALLLKGYDPVVSVAVGTAGNTLGALTTYAVGIYGGAFLIKRILRVDDEAREKAQRFYKRYGSWTLFLSWVPFIGDSLCLVGGILRINFWRFFLLVGGGKLFRYGVATWVVLKVVEGR